MLLLYLAKISLLELKKNSIPSGKQQMTRTYNPGPTRNLNLASAWATANGNTNFFFYIHIRSTYIHKIEGKGTDLA